MKVFFACTTISLEKYKQQYFNIRDHIVAKGHTLTRDWLPNIKNHSREFEDKRNGSEEIYKLTIEALDKADVLIVEDTVESFSNGHLITIALQRRLPVLVLWHHDKERYFSRGLIEGIKSELLALEYYKDSEYKQVIDRFLGNVDKLNQKNHFHLVMNDLERDYLDWLSFKANKSRTNIITESIRDKMQDDEDYNKYLEKL